MRARAPRTRPTLPPTMLERLRAGSPRVHCITNAVAQALSANMLLAAGAVPSMTVDAGGGRRFRRRADALLVNLGTMDADRRTAAGIAVDVASERRYSVGARPDLHRPLGTRAAFARALVALHPRAIRLNRPEFVSLAGSRADGRGARRLCAESRAAIGLTGETDLVADGSQLATHRQWRSADGEDHRHGLRRLGAGRRLPRGRAGRAGAPPRPGWCCSASPARSRPANARGPGSLLYGLMDVLHGLDRATLLAHARIS